MTKGQRRCQRHQARHLHHLQRLRPRALKPGLLHRRTHLHDVSGFRQNHQRPLPELRWLRTCAQRKNALGQHPGRRRRRHTHPAYGRRRSGHARGGCGRFVYFPIGQTASNLWPRGRRHPLQRADFNDHRCAWRLDRSPHHRWRARESDHPRRHAKRPPVPTARQRHVDFALFVVRRYVYRNHGRNPGETRQKTAAAAPARHRIISLLKSKSSGTI